MKQTSRSCTVHALIQNYLQVLLEGKLHLYNLQNTIKQQWK